MADEHSDDQFTDAQNATLRTLYIISVAIYTFNLAFALYNVFKYPIRSRKGGTLVIIFYILVIILCLSEIGLNLPLAINVQKRPLLWI